MSPPDPAVPKAQARPGRAFTAANPSPSGSHLQPFPERHPPPRCRLMPAKIPEPSRLPRSVAAAAAAGGVGLGWEGARQEHSQATAPGQAKQTQAAPRSRGEIVHK